MSPDDQLVTGRDLGRALCAVFGLDFSRTKRITIDIAADDMATVTVEQFIPQGLAGGIEAVATTYGLHRATPPPPLEPASDIAYRLRALALPPDGRNDA